MMNFWVPAWEGWNNGFDPTDFPWYAKYDYVEVWDYVEPDQWSSTDGADEDHPFQLRWRDDFDTFDETKWVKSNNWSFNDNLVTFMESNVYVQDGNLVLKLEPKSSPVAPFPEETTDPNTDPIPDPTPDPTPPIGCDNYEIDRVFYPGNTNY